MSDSIYYERKLAPLIGLSRDALIYLRKDLLKKDLDYTRDGRDTVITQAGLDTILASMRATSNSTPVDIDFSPALVPAPEKKEGPDPEPALTEDLPDASPGAADAAPIEEDKPEEKKEPVARGLVELTVVRCYPNPRMLRATTPAGDLVDVRVKTNRNFVPRMTLRARLVTVGKYEMEGRCPRTRGRY